MTMMKGISRGRVIALWFGAVVVAMAGSVTAGAAPSLGTWVLLLVMSLAPPAILLLVWHGAPPLTVAELLHSVNTKDGSHK
jgi:hypothetical protein